MNDEHTTTARRPVPAAVSIRRQRVQRQVATHRAAVGDAWTSFEQASLEAQAKAHRVIDWARTLSAIAALVAVVIALRRVATRGKAAPAVRGVALASLIRRVVPAVRKLFSTYP